MRLYLDDIRVPYDPYDVIARNATAAIILIQTGVVEYISFDHDLGFSNELTGYDVAKEIEKLAYSAQLPRIMWNIHSANPVGRANIERAMKNADKYWSMHEDAERRLHEQLTDEDEEII
jgi:hypothetical protein